ncbi:MAG: response regulator [Gemmatimonadota bacterium]|nr:response regulator [Gemmatimonadota bacterium]
MGKRDEALVVIVVEDEADLRELFVFALEASKFEVHAASSVAEATKLLDHLNADVLIADFSLPDGTGPVLLDLCAKARPRACILLSGHDARDLPASDFDVLLLKPVLPERLVREIRERFPDR